MQRPPVKGINPIEKFLNIRNPNSTDIEANLKSIVERSRPTEIRFEKAGDKDPGPYSRGSSRSSEPFDRWILYYRYTTEQQNEQYLHTVRKEKKLKQKNQDLPPKKKKIKSRQYRPPIIR